MSNTPPTPNVEVVQADELSALKQKLRMVVSHATGGASSDIDASTNDICVLITQHVNRVYQHGKEASHTPSPDISGRARETEECAFVDRFGNEVRTSRAAYQEIRWLREKLEGHGHKTERHIFRTPAEGGETCADCGANYRAPIHLRSDERARALNPETPNVE